MLVCLLGLVLVRVQCVKLSIADFVAWQYIEVDHFLPVIDNFDGIKLQDTSSN